MGAAAREPGRRDAPRAARASPGRKARGLTGAAARRGRYMRLGYAHMDNLPFAAIKNRAGSYVTPDPNPAAKLAVALPSSISSPRWDRVNLATNGAPPPRALLCTMAPPARPGACSVLGLTEG
jgi:hypothetical protein